MHDELDLKNDPNNSRHARSSKVRTPRASRSTRRAKKTAAAATVGGSHRRRNKHWNW